MSQGQLLARDGGDAQPSPSKSFCDSLFQFYVQRYIQKTFKYGLLKREVPYYTEKGRPLDDRPPTRSVLPQFSHDRRLIIVVDKEAHVYLVYKNHSISAYGKGGLLVTTHKYKNETLRGDMALIIHSLPEETLAKLDEMIKNFEERSERSCAMVTCQYIQPILPDVITRSTRWPSSLVRQLITAKLSGKSIEIVSISGKSPEATMRQIRRRELTTALPLLVIELIDTLHSQEAP